MATALEIVKEDRKKLVELVIEGLEKKGTGWFKEWQELATPHNGTNETVYHGGNKLKLGTIALKHNFSDPRWATEKQIKEKGWEIPTNATPVKCEFWKFAKDKEIVNKETGEIEKKEVPPTVRWFNVYNFSQLNGKIPKLEIPERPKDKELENILEILKKSSKCIIEYKTQNEAFYNPKNDIITMPHTDLFKNSLSEVSTLSHEMAHSTGHSERLNREMKGKFGSEEYAKEELRAEISSMFFQASLNLPAKDREFNNNQEYIKSWIAVLRNDPNEIYRASSVADKITDYMINNYTEIEKSVEKEIKETREIKPIEIDMVKIKEQSKSKDKGAEIEL